MSVMDASFHSHRLPTKPVWHIAMPLWEGASTPSNLVPYEGVSRDVVLRDSTMMRPNLPAACARWLAISLEWAV